jgi:hypothetical protein
MHAPGQYWCGAQVGEDKLEHSDLIKELADRYRCTLTENKRSDPELFEFVTGLGVNTPSQKSVEEARNEATRRFKPTGEKPRYTLVLSHKRRVQINAQRLLEEKPEGAVYIPVGPLPKQNESRNLPQDLYCWEGQELVGYSAKVRRGLLYTVKQATSQHIVVSDAAGEKDIKLSHKHAVQMLRPSYSLTYAGVQGLTLQGRVRLETGSRNLHIKHLYVGASRATAAALLEVV